MSLREVPTSRRITANCLNALKSTGPRTNDGRFRSALNLQSRRLVPEALERELRARGDDPRDFWRLQPPKPTKPIRPKPRRMSGITQNRVPPNPLRLSLSFSVGYGQQGPFFRKKIVAFRSPNPANPFKLTTLTSIGYALNGILQTHCGYLQSSQSVKSQKGPIFDPKMAAQVMLVFYRAGSRIPDVPASKTDTIFRSSNACRMSTVVCLDFRRKGGHQGPPLRENDVGPEVRGRPSLNQSGSLKPGRAGQSTMIARPTVSALTEWRTPGATRSPKPPSAWSFCA